VHTTEEGKEQVVEARKQCNGRPYVFYRKDFVDADNETVTDDSETPYTRQTELNLTDQNNTGIELPDDDLPF